MEFYIGTDLSNWVTAVDFRASVESNEWLGLSFGERRPITPTDQSEQLNVKEVLNSKSAFILIQAMMCSI